ncbi:cytochrome c [Salipiger sp. P9]|uniref:c-type cytochrome n=1 Tax=Salipiger pentaromativorans TaxID=2943193 RepID=UPI002157295F|nr:cytochrome c [Salipiger pentaromativorans]MCR8550643.1 cytochrome c [Salipiger pentaromativorans]
MVRGLLLGLAALLALFGAPAMAQDLSVDELVAKGKSRYSRMCSRCHGAQMRNSGNSSFDLRKFPAEEFGRFRSSVTDGKGRMPSWGDVLRPGDIEALWAYVTTQAGSRDMPEAARAALAGDEAVPEEEGAAALETVAPGVLTVCLARNGGAMSGWRHDGGVGLDYLVSRALAEALNLRFAAAWYEAEGGTDPRAEAAALMSYGLCDLVPAHPLLESAVGAPSVPFGQMPEWLGQPDQWYRRNRIALEPIAVTAPYRRAEMGLVLAPSAGERDPAGLGDLGGLRLAYQGNTLAQLVVRMSAPPDLRADAQAEPPGAGFLWRMETGLADAALIEVGAYDFHRRQNSVTGLRLGSWRHPLGINLGFAVLARQDALRQAADAALTGLLESGQVAAFAAQSGVHHVPPRPPLGPATLTMAAIARLN